MKKLYKIFCLLPIIPLVNLVSSCAAPKTSIGVGRLQSLELINNVKEFSQPTENDYGSALILSSDDNKQWNILNSEYKDVRFETILGTNRYSHTDFKFEDWAVLKLELQMQFQFQKKDFDTKTWEWLDKEGEYGGNQGANITEIFDPRTRAHFQYTFNVYHEINTVTPQDPTKRAPQYLYKASSSTINHQTSTSLINEFMALNITPSDDGNGVNWTITWTAPLNSFYNLGLSNNLNNFQFKLLTQSLDDSQLITPSGDVIGFAYTHWPKNEYFTLINDGKKWS